MNRFNFIILFAFFCSPLSAQIPQITGFVSDEVSGESLQGAIITDSSSFQYTYANREGYYNLGVPSGKHTIIFTASGYEKKRFVVDVYNSVTLSVKLDKLGPFDDDTISNLHHTINDYRSGHVAPLASQINQMPSLMCEPDPVKFLQYMPGVSGGIEGLAGMYVRGGNADQNLQTMDGLPVYGNGHVFGFLSNYNPDVVRDVQFYRGVMPARYGGRAGSVMDVSLIDGAKDDFHGSFSADPMAFKLQFNGPVNASGTTTFVAGMRRSWIDLLLPKGGKDYLYYNLHDYNLKLTFRPNVKNRISIWFYNGRDKFALKSTSVTTDTLNQVSSEIISTSIIWQNTLAGVNFSHRFSDRHYGNFIAGMTRYTYKFPISLNASITSDSAFDDYNLKYEQNVSITDFIVKANMEYNYNSNNSLRYGLELINHSFVPSTELIELASGGVTGLDTIYGNANKQLAQEASAYGEWETNLGAGLKMNLGARIWVYSSREKTYIRPEPRIMISQLLEGKKALKMGFSMANQGIHQLSSVNGNLPNDVWFPTSGNFRPQNNMQITGGISQPWRKGIEFSLDLYYKWMDGITDLRSDDENNLQKNYWEGMVAQGKGTAYGLEILAIKKTGRLNGLVSYTWSKSTREMDDINFGVQFPFRWDRRHKGVVQGVYKVQDDFTLNFAMVLMSGNAVSVPTGKYVTVDGSFVYDYSEKNNYRMPFYKRVDFGFTRKMDREFADDGSQYWGIQIYNIFNFKNPVFLDINRGSSSVSKAIGYSYFQFIPTAFYRWEF